MLKHIQQILSEIETSVDNFLLDILISSFIYVQKKPKKKKYKTQ